MSCLYLACLYLECEKNADIHRANSILLFIRYVLSIFRLNKEKCKENPDIQSLSDLKVGQS